MTVLLARIAELELMLRHTRARERYWRKRAQGQRGPRLNRRIRPERPLYVPPGHCAGCGAPVDDRTPGCTNCTSRHWHRRRDKQDALRV